MIDISKRLFKAIQASGYTYRELSSLTGISASALQRYATGYTGKIPIDRVKKLAFVLNVSPEYLLGWDEPDFPLKTKIPVYGEIAAGYPMLEVQDIEDYEEISEEMARSGDYIALRIHGESMMPRICDGDVIIIRLQNNCDNGDICAVCVNGDTATCKKVKYTENGMMLLPLNPSFDPMFYTKEECENLPVRIIGKVVELRGKF